MVIEPGDVRVRSTKRNPGWYDAAMRPGAVGRRVSGPPTPARPTDSSDAGAPGKLLADVPTANGPVSAESSVTVRGAVVVKAVMVRVCAVSPAPKVIVLPTSRPVADASVTCVAPATAAADTV